MLKGSASPHSVGGSSEAATSAHYYRLQPFRTKVLTLVSFFTMAHQRASIMTSIITMHTVVRFLASAVWIKL